MGYSNSSTVIQQKTRDSVMRHESIGDGGLHWKLLLPVICMTVLSACQAIPLQEAAVTHQLPVAGSRLKLIHPLPVSADSARSIVQHGVVTKRPDLYSTWCTFHMYRAHTDLSKATQIRAGEFKILKTWFHRESSYLPRFRDGITSASAGDLKTSNRQGTVWDGDSHSGFRRWNVDASRVTFSTMIDVQSTQDNSVHRIVCSVFDDPAWDHYPSLGEIRKALGGIVQIDF